MSESNITDTTRSSETDDLKALCADFEKQAHTLRVAILIVATTLCLFFWREAKFNGHLADAMKGQVLQVSQYVKAMESQGSSIGKQELAIKTFVSRLIEYGKTHPDYVPILAKYGIPMPSAQSSGVPAPQTPAASPKK